jgi:dipeptidyl aminopeptidase/acylaminoacyl peptidase
MKRCFAVLVLVLAALPALAQNSAAGQQSFIRPGDNLVVENIPPIPAAIAEKANQYGEYRIANLLDWDPVHREMLVRTRFADVPQVHLVKAPGGARTQLTFFPDRVLTAHYGPQGSNYFVFGKDVGGGEWFQFYRYDLSNGNVTLLTDGKSRNLDAQFAHHDNRFVYSSTRRTGKDTDIWIMDATDPHTDKMLLQLEGGGWGADDWSPDNKQVLLSEVISANQSYLWLVDVPSGEKKLLTPKGGQDKDEISYAEARFSKDGKGIYVTTDRDSEFHRLAYFDLGAMQPTYLTSDIKWDVSEFELSEDGKTIAFVTNEDGISKVYLLDTATRRIKPVSGVPTGVIIDLNFHKNSRDVGFAVSSARSPFDIYSLDTKSGKIDRWTFSETGGLNTATFAEPQLVKWPTFDGKTISGFLYRPDPNKFPGKRPVIVNIHGGPEGQSRPDYLGRNNYYITELGVAIIYPNVRGSIGYGKTFLKLDNGFHRDDTYKDIGALLDWIKENPNLDADKVMITGGSYGGHMTNAVATFYSDRICCSLPVVGITNLVSLLEHTEAYRRDLRRVEYGDERDPKMREYLEKIAPLNNSEKIRKPLFAVVGKNDPRVPWSESRQILEKLKNSGVPTWFLMANDEGHGYAKKKNLDFQFYATVMFVRQFLLGENLSAASKG